MGTRGYFSRNVRHTDTAWSNCGPGITETPSSSTGWPRIRASMVAHGSGSALPSTISYSSRPFEHRAQVENGERQAPVLRLGAARMEQDDHAVNLPARIQKLRGRTLAVPARLPRPQRPLPAIPGTIDLPRDAQVAAQFGEHLLVEVLDALERVGGEAVSRLELLVALAAHHFAVLAAAVDGRIDNQKAAARAQAAADFGERAAVVGGVVNRSVVDGQRPGCPAASGRSSNSALMRGNAACA